MTRYRAILIAGPTAGGKSAAAMAVAEASGGTVVNADSMQVYRDLKILTARPDEIDEARVPHVLYGHIDAAEPYSAGCWLDDVESVLQTIEAEGRVPVITGGTGLYFKALLEGLSPVPDIAEEVRVHWRGVASTEDPVSLHAMLAKRDPEMATRLRPSDPQRIVRALEVIEATGRSLARWQEEPGVPLLPDRDVLKLRISPSREVLHERIDARFDAMVENGALKEVAALAQRKLDPALPVMRAIGVPALMAHIGGEVDRDAAIAQAKTETRRYAKRQETWAKRNMVAWNLLNEKEMESLQSKLFSFIDV